MSENVEQKRLGDWVYIFFVPPFIFAYLKSNTYAYTSLNFSEGLGTLVGYFVIGGLIGWLIARIFMNKTHGARPMMIGIMSSLIATLSYIGHMSRM